MINTFSLEIIIESPDDLKNLEKFVYYNKTGIIAGSSELFYDHVNIRLVKNKKKDNKYVVYIGSYYDSSKINCKDILFHLLNNILYIFTRSYSLTCIDLIFNLVIRNDHKFIGSYTNDKDRLYFKSSKLILSNVEILQKHDFIVGNFSLETSDKLYKISSNINNTYSMYLKLKFKTNKNIWLEDRLFCIILNKSELTIFSNSPFNNQTLLDEIKDSIYEIISL